MRVGVEREGDNWQAEHADLFTRSPSASSVAAVGLALVSQELLHAVCRACQSRLAQAARSLS